jgi:hypothetical protein
MTIDRRAENGPDRMQATYASAGSRWSPSFIGGANLVNRLFQVARTYLYRPRFWIFGLIYLLLWLPWWQQIDPHSSDHQRLQVALDTLVTANFGCVLACLLALHVRRQFGNAGAKIIPRFAVPHLIVAAGALAVLWVGASWVQAWLMGAPPWLWIAIHSAVPIFFALVICGRPTIVFLAVLPFSLIAAHGLIFARKTNPVSDFLLGREPLAAAVLIAVGVLACGLAAWLLVRGLEYDARVSDDFLTELPRTEWAAGRLDERLLTYRDAAVERALAGTGNSWWAIQRWRVPAMISWAHILVGISVAVLFVAAMVAGVGQRSAAVVGGFMATAGLLMAPFAPWHSRRNFMGMELMRPVARAQYFRQLAAALAVDVMVWTCVTLLFCLGIVSIVNWNNVPAWGLLAVWSAVICGLTVMWYGVGMVTMHLRFWPVVMVSLYFFCLICTINFTQWYDPKGDQMVMDVLLFIGASSSCGGLLATLAYQRWNRLELN